MQQQQHHMSAQAHNAAHTGSNSGYNYPRYDATPEASTSAGQVLQIGMPTIAERSLHCVGLQAAASNREYAALMLAQVCNR